MLVRTKVPTRFRVRLVRVVRLEALSPRLSSSGSVTELVSRRSRICERLHHTARDRAAVRDRHRDEMKDGSAVFGPTFSFGADAAPMRAQAAPSTTGHHEPDVLVHVFVK